ncbi:fibronectin type III domain-containing protein [Nocardioides speluncae]|uniref:fibronectin type III domain-containing protein n=1 Tax=Nocardioides speluncae TaxID=2670337 RepID=UPI000D68C42F|nr:fibronectin type III domain-containing protein [Nocardioides speluncae]
MRLAARTVLAGLAAMALAVAVAPTATAADTTPPTAPTNVRVLDVTADVVTIAFNPSTDKGGLKWYTVHAGTRTQATTSPSRTDFGGLRAGTTYSLTVRAVDKAGNVSAPSTPVTFTTDPWPAVPNVQVTSVVGGDVSLSWGRPSGMDPYRYLIYDGGQPEAVINWERLTMRNLAPGTHSFTVRGWHVSGTLTPPSDPVTVTVAPRGTDLMAPSPPGNPVSVEEIETYEFDTTWTASTDAVDSSSSLTYDMLQAWPGGLFTSRYGVVGTGDHGTVTYAVRAVDPHGNRSAPAAATIVW